MRRRGHSYTQYSDGLRCCADRTHPMRWQVGQTMQIMVGDEVAVEDIVDRFK
jgi:hypothetical protein